MKAARPVREGADGKVLRAAGVTRRRPTLHEKWYSDNVEPATKHQKGFVSRQLLRSTENLDEGLSITVWETRDDMENYDRSPERQKYTREMEPLYTGEYWVKKYEVRAST